MLSRLPISIVPLKANNSEKLTKQLYKSLVDIIYRWKQNFMNG